MYFDQDYNIQVKTTLKNERDEEVFKIGHSVQSCTSIPTLFRFKNGIYFADCPGFFDSMWTNEYINQSSIHHIQINSSNVVIIFIFSVSDLTNQRSLNFIKSVTNLLRLYSNCHDKLAVVPILMNYQAMKQPMQVFARIGKIQRNIQERYSNDNKDDQSNYYQTEYPAEEEVEKFVALCETIKN